MPVKKLTTLTVAQHACQYARDEIRIGSSQLQLNDYAVEHRMALFNAVNDVRANMMHAVANSVIDKAVACFEVSIAHCKKYSLGNCEELALMALHYMVTTQSNINAEMYAIIGGDHAFLVVGRKQGSDPSNPTTWGKAAMICDPWSNTVYPASEYLTKLKGFRAVMTSHGDYKNTVMNFNPHFHKLMPAYYYNSSYMLKNATQSNNILLDVFSNIYTSYFNEFEQLTKSLEMIAKKIKMKCGQNDPAYRVITEKIAVIREVIARQKEGVHECVNSIKNENTGKTYLSPKEVLLKLQKKMRVDFIELRESTKLSEEQRGALKREVLSSPRIWFMSNKTTVFKQYANAIQKAEETTRNAYSP
jgi:hypothetical protein